VRGDAPMIGRRGRGRMLAVTRLAKRVISLLVLWVATVRVLVETAGGATCEERQRDYPGDDLVPGERRGSTMAVTIDAPPTAIWPWLVQMGCGRAGFYSIDRLDNGGEPSAERIHPEWQGLAEGDRIPSTPDGRFWFDVARLEPERLLVLAANIDTGAKRSIPFDAPMASHGMRGLWTFVLEPVGDDATRLIVRGRGEGRPVIVNRAMELVFFDFAHWLMQRVQFANLRRRAEALAHEPAAGSGQPSPLVASRG
jgi:hypothetical protein